jgi:hypothetical protein
VQLDDIPIFDLVLAPHLLPVEAGLTPHARIAERAARGTPCRNAKNRAAFLAVRDDVKHAIDDGWPVNTIWQTLHEEKKIAFSYQAFRIYVNRLIRLETERSRVARKEGRMGKGDQPGAHSVDKKSTTAVRGFTFDSAPKKEDLI